MLPNQKICITCNKTITYVSAWVANHSSDSGMCSECYKLKRKEVFNYFTICPGCDEKIFFKFASAICRAKKRGPAYCKSCATIKPQSDLTGISVRELKANWPEYKKYSLKVRRISENQNIKELENYKNRGLKTYHLDHKIPIILGFIHKIAPEIVGNISNLVFVPYKINLSKSGRLMPEYIELLEYMLKQNAHSN
jgi:hypothetical protein